MRPTSSPWHFYELDISNDPFIIIATRDVHGCSHIAGKRLVRHDDKTALLFSWSVRACDAVPVHQTVLRSYSAAAIFLGFEIDLTTHIT